MKIWDLEDVKNNKIYNAIRAEIKTSPRIKYENVK